MIDRCLVAGFISGFFLFSTNGNAVLVSQGNFDKELGLKQKQLELDKQNSKFSHAYEMYLKRLMGRKNLMAATGGDKLPTETKNGLQRP